MGRNMRCIAHEPRSVVIHLSTLSLFSPSPPSFHPSSPPLPSPFLSPLLPSCPLSQGVGDPPSESQSSKHHASGGSRHSTGGSIRVSTHSTPTTHRGSSTSDHSPSSNSTFASANPTMKKSSRKQQQQHGAVGESSGQSGVGVESVPLPEGLVDRLKASNWSERFEAVSDLENFVNVYPTALAPHLHKVSDYCLVTMDNQSPTVHWMCFDQYRCQTPAFEVEP